MPGYPLFVNISVTESAALAGWLRRSATIGLGSAALFLCSLFLLVAITIQVRCLSDSEALLTQKSQQLDAALNNMPEGLAMFDGQQRLVVCDRHYFEMYSLPPERTRPGTPLHAIVEARAAGGNSPERQDYVADVLERTALRKPHYTVDEVRDGRIFSASHQPMSNGGWASIHQDIACEKSVASFFSTSAVAAEVNTLRSADAAGRVANPNNASAVADQIAARPARAVAGSGRMRKLMPEKMDRTTADGSRLDAAKFSPEQNHTRP